MEDILNFTCICVYVWAVRIKNVTPSKKVSKFKHNFELKKVYKPKVYISEDSLKDWQFTKPAVSRIMEL